MPDDPRPPGNEIRGHWMGVLARSGARRLAEAWAEVEDAPVFTLLRAPETGLVMVRGRAGGDGQRFNLGEMTVTRCAVRCIDQGREIIGHAYVRGRDRQHCELAARFDALLQIEGRRERLMSTLIAGLAAEETSRRERLRRKAAATRVDFFTLVRGES